MANYVPVSPERHAGKHWLRSGRYHFAMSAPLVALTPEELFPATKEMTAAFIKTADRYVLIALLSLNQKVNLYIAPDGRWIGSYTPAMLRAYPFRLARSNEGNGANKVALVVDEEAGLTEEGEPFYDAQGALTKPVREFVEFLKKVEQDRARMERIVKSLDDAGVIEEWPLTLKSGENEQRIAGLFRISEEKLNQLDDERFLGLRQGGLAVAYAQLLSMRNIHNLRKLAEARAEFDKQASQQKDAIFKAPETDWLNVDWSKVQ
jgi:hypothetical protein